MRSPARGGKNTSTALARAIAVPCVVLLQACVVSAACAVGGTSSLPAPASIYLRSYRASLGTPSRVAVDDSGNTYVADPGLRQVLVRAPSGRILSRAENLGRPLGIAVGDTGTVYVGDVDTGSVTAFDADWQPLFQLGQGAGEFSRPNDIAVDAATGNVYVADTAAQQIKVYTATGSLLSSFGGQGAGDGLFNFPAGVYVDAAARQVLVADQLNYRIQIFDVQGNFLSCFGAQGSSPGRFNMPQGVTADGQGRVYVADALEGRIQVLDRNGAFLGYVGDFGEAGGQLRIPTGLAIDPSNRLFVAAANNARLEIYGLDAFSDPETVLPAVVRMQPQLIDRAIPNGAVAADVEVPGYTLEQIVPGSMTVNGVAPMSPPAIGDRDNDGVPDVRLELDRAALLATLPAAGSGAIAVSGMLGELRLEGSAAVQVATCAPQTKCPLGNADPQCNDAVCVDGVGCTVQPKTEGSGCEDGDACTVEDTCSAGVCAGAVLTCDDLNPCTDDSCDAVTGCVFSNNTAVCDDADPGTVGDLCDGQGQCLGRVVTGRYAVLESPVDTRRHNAVSIGRRALMGGDVCGESLRLGSFAHIDGTAVGWASVGRAVALHRNSQVTGDVVTGGASVVLMPPANIGGQIDQSGTGAAVSDCAAARYRADSRRAEWTAQVPSPGYAQGRIAVRRGDTMRLPSSGTLGTGAILIDTAGVRLGPASTLTLVGDASTETVVVRVHGKLSLGSAARLEAQGVPPERVMVMVDGPVFLHRGAALAGSLSASGHVRLGNASAVSGAVLGDHVDVASDARVTLHPFIGW